MTVKELSDVSNLSGNAQALVQDDSTPSAYLASLEKQELYQDAIRFLAHKLTVDAGIKWAVACVREMKAPDRKDQKDEPLDAAEVWSKAPDDQSRRAAKAVHDKTEKSGPGNLVALAVFFSGGSIAAPSAPETPPPPYAAQKFIAGSIQIAVIGHDPKNAKERYQRALTMGKTFDVPGKA